MVVLIISFGVEVLANQIVLLSQKMDFFPIVLVALFVFHLSLSSKAFILTEEFTWRTYDENRYLILLYKRR